MSTEILERDATSPQTWAMIEDCINASVDSAKVTAHCAQSVAAGHPEAESFCQHCAEVCDHYAAECEKSENEKRYLFAKACRLFAEECRKMAKNL